MFKLDTAVYTFKLSAQDKATILKALYDVYLQGTITLTFPTPKLS